MSRACPGSRELVADEGEGCVPVPGGLSCVAPGEEWAAGNGVLMPTATPVSTPGIRFLATVGGGATRSPDICPQSSLVGLFTIGHPKGDKKVNKNDLCVA